MGGSRFVRPETTVLKISNGDTLTVKRRLTSGEQRASFARMYLAGVTGDLTVNPLQVGMAMVTAYLIDWSLTYDDGQVAPIRGVSVEELTATLDNLDPESFSEIRQAIEQHAAAMEAERDDAKKKMAGENRSVPISSLPSALDSRSTKSETLM